MYASVARGRLRDGAMARTVVWAFSRAVTEACEIYLSLPQAISQPTSTGLLLAGT